MSDHSRLTFIVPVYNPKSEVFTKMLRSLCEQSLKDWEAIFVLDGPCDMARQIIKSQMLRVENSYRIEEIEHGGANKARNKGQEFARGEFIVHLDADCYIEPDTAKTWLAMFDKYPSVAFVYSGYKFEGDKGAINSEPFDPYLLRVRNYISSCFPVRKAFCPKWDESLSSLQDWSFWLSVTGKGGVGKFLPGYAFSTEYPDDKSISGTGCLDTVWLDRVDAVKKLHNLPERDICVSSLTNKHEGVALAKTIGADYQDYPNFKPHRYSTIIQLGFSFLPNRIQDHVSIFQDKDIKKVIYWTCDDITEIYSRLNYIALKKYRLLINQTKNLSQFVEDKTAYDMMREIGFEVTIKPLPMVAPDLSPLPEKARFAVDIDGNYNQFFAMVEKSLPDIELVPLKGALNLADFTGLCHFHPDKTMSPSMKRALLMGRHVVSNVQAPFAGFVDDSQNLSTLIPQTVEKIREVAYAGKVSKGRDYYIRLSSPEKF